jgi:hypothetical protein
LPGGLIEVVPEAQIPPALQGLHSSNIPPLWRRIARGIGNLLLLPLRLLLRLLLDLKEALTNAFFSILELAIGFIFLAFVLGLMAIESFGENFFVGEVLQKRFPSMKTYVPQSGVAGMFAAMWFPLLDDVRAAAIFAFIISLSSVAAMAVFFHYFEDWRRLRSEPLPATQEALLLDNQVQEEETEIATQPQLVIQKRGPVLIGLCAGGFVQLIIFVFEIAALANVLSSALFGVLCALLLLVIRTIIGYLAHLCIKPMLPYFQELQRRGFRVAHTPDFSQVVVYDLPLPQDQGTWTDASGRCIQRVSVSFSIPFDFPYSAPGIGRDS